MRKFLSGWGAALLLLLVLAGTVAAETIELDVPLYLQKDERWKNVFLNVGAGGEDLTIGKAGCTLCCLAACESLRLGEEITPYDELFRVEFSGDELHWPKEYEALARSQVGLWVREAAPILLSCLRSGRPALVGMYSEELGSHWVVVYGCRDLDPQNPQTVNFLIRDPGTRYRMTLNEVKEYFPAIRIIRTYDVTSELRAAAKAALAIP